MPVSENWKRLLSKGLLPTPCEDLTPCPAPSSLCDPSPKPILKTYTDPDLARIIKEAVALTTCSNESTEIFESSEDIASNENHKDEDEDVEDQEDIFDAISSGNFVPTFTNTPSLQHFPTDPATRPTSINAWFEYLNRKAKFVGKTDQIGKYIGMDCEMVGVGHKGRASALARISIINFHGHVLLDQYIKPKVRIVDYRTKHSGITPKHMKEAVPFSKVDKQIKELLSQRFLIGHDLGHDLKVLRYFHSKTLFRDTSRYPAFLEPMGQRPSLKNLAQKFLGLSIQKDLHDSVEDARVAMLLYRLYKDEWEKYLQCEITTASLTKQLAVPVLPSALHKIDPLSISAKKKRPSAGFNRKKVVNKRTVGSKGNKKNFNVKK